MQEFFEIVKRLEDLRGLPQFVYYGGITRSNANKVRLQVLEFKKNNPEKKEIDFILESPGGIADFAYIIIRTLRENFDKVNIVIPYWAKSAATLLSFGGTTIIMDEFAEFGPLDMQLRGSDFPDSEFKSALIDEYSLSIIEERSRRLYKEMMLDILTDKKTRIEKIDLSQQILSYIPSLYKPLLDKIDPFEIGSKARTLAIAEEYAKRILVQFNKENVKDNIDSFIAYIVHECPDHRYIIDYSLISQFLSNVKKASEVGEEYCTTLTELSLFLFSDMSSFSYVGFFDKKLLEKKKEVIDTKDKLTKTKDLKKKEGKGDEAQTETNE